MIKTVKIEKGRDLREIKKSLRDCLEVRASRLKRRLLICIIACRVDGGSKRRSRLVMGLGREMRDSVLVRLRFRCPRVIQVELSGR